MRFRRMSTVAAALAVLSMSCNRAPDAGPAKMESSMAAQGAEKVFDPDKAVLEGPGRFLQPRLGKWVLASEPRYFRADTLYDLINGGAEIFVEFGFTRIVTADYRMDGDPRTITAEVYHMGTPLGAFGRVARYLENMADPSQAGERLPEVLRPFGIMGDGDLLVWKGAYLVHLTLLDESADATPESIAAAGDSFLPAMAGQILDRVEGAAELPSDLQKFPIEHLIGRSHAWHPQHINGIATLRDGFTARYADDSGRTWALFFTSPAASNDEAEKTAATIRKVMAENGILAVEAHGNRVMGVFKDAEPAPDNAFVKSRLTALLSAF